MITDGVLLTDDAEIRSPALRLDYRGTVAMDRRVNARVEAQVLRDVWLIGPIVSTVLWPFAKMFEYKVEGTLSHPRTELLYFGKPAGAPVQSNSGFQRTTPEKHTGPAESPARGP